MATPEDLHRQLDKLSEILSERTRWVSFSVLAFCWAFVIARHKGAEPFVGPEDVLGPMVLGLLALLIDFLQYAFGYVQNLRMLRRLPANPEAVVQWDPSDPLYRLRLHAFHAKIAVAFVAAGWLIVVLSVRLSEVV